MEENPVFSHHHLQLHGRGGGFRESVGSPKHQKKYTCVLANTWRKETRKRKRKRKSQDLERANLFFRRETSNVWMKWYTVGSLSITTNRWSRLTAGQRYLGGAASRKEIRRMLGWPGGKEGIQEQGKTSTAIGVSIIQGLPIFAWSGHITHPRPVLYGSDSCPGNGESELALVPNEGKDEGYWSPPVAVSWCRSLQVKQTALASTRTKLWVPLS